MLKKSHPHTGRRRKIGEKWGGRLALALALALCTVTSTWAQARELFAVEGPITSVGVRNKTMTANGILFRIPDNVPIDGTTGITGATLSRLRDNAAPNRVRSIFGAKRSSGFTTITTGIVKINAAGNRRHIAQSVFIEPAENVVVGTVLSVDVATQSLNVNGITVKMNPDERFASPNFASLVGSVGSEVSIEGYFHNADKSIDPVQYAVAIEVVGPSLGGEIWAIEGPSTGMRAGVNEFDVNGMTITVPDALILDGTEGLFGSTMNSLQNKFAPNRVRSIFGQSRHSGFTGIMSGHVETDAGGIRTYVADFFSIGPAENVTLGTLESVDVLNNCIVVNGVTVKGSPDERFPGVIGDIGGEPIADLSILNGILGTEVSIEGYWHSTTPRAGTHYGQAIQTDFLPPSVGTDTVRITGGRTLLSTGRFRCLGVVGPFDATAMITISDADTGTVLGTVPQVLDVATGRGTFSLRLRDLPKAPRVIRAVSDNGGEHTTGVEVRA